MRRILIITLFFFAAEAKAAIEIVSISGFSNSNYTQSDVTTPTVWAGTAGTCTGTTTATCNSCLDTNTACNTTRVHTALNLTIEFRDTDLSGNGSPIALLGGNAIAFDASPSSGATNSTVSTINITWANICGGMATPDNTCGTDGTVTLDFGYDTDGTTSTIESSRSLNIVLAASSFNTSTASGSNPGISAVEFYPGDEKAFIRTLTATPDTTFPQTTNGTSFTTLRVFFSTNNFDDNKILTSTTAGLFQDFTIETTDTAGEADITERTVTGLVNDTTYYFKLALIDEANNLMGITDDSLYVSGTGDPNCPAAVTGTLTNDTDIFNCTYTAKPEIVFGLLTDDLNCFISTAAYGSSFAPKVQDFREFRNRFLLPNEWGEKFVISYYKYGPQIAMSIQNSEILKQISRAVLYPAWLFAKGSINYGLKKTLVALFGSFLFLILASVKVIRWRKDLM